MNLKQMKYVVALANIGSFSGAAEYLEISQPSLSQYIKKIEKELDADLFERANGSVHLTDAGKVYLETGKKMLELEQDMLHRLDDVANYKEGSITVGTSPFRSATMMPMIVKKFKEQYPGMHLIIREMTTQELLESTERGEFDLCLTNLPVDETLFQCEIIMEEEILLAVKKGSKLDRRLSRLAVGEKRSIDAVQLNGEAFVMLTEQQVMQKELNRLCYQNRLVVETAVVVKSLEAQIEMVATGVGCAIVPMGIQKSARMQQDVRYYSFLQDLPKRTLAVIYQKEKYLSKPMRNLIEILKEQ